MEDETLIESRRTLSQAQANIFVCIASFNLSQDM